MSYNNDLSMKSVLSQGGNFLERSMSGNEKNNTDKRRIIVPCRCESCGKVFTRYFFLYPIKNESNLFRKAKCTHCNKEYEIRIDIRLMDENAIKNATVRGNKPEMKSVLSVGDFIKRPTIKNGDLEIYDPEVEYEKSEKGDYLIKANRGYSRNTKEWIAEGSSNKVGFVCFCGEDFDDNVCGFEVIEVASSNKWCRVVPMYPSDDEDDSLDLEF